ncbi:hypothetical protein D3C81_1448720 [compost metagenome]
MLDDHAGRLTELFDAFQRGVGIGDVVIGQCLALQLVCCSDRGFLNVLFYIEGSLLVAVFAVAHILLLDVVKVQGAWETAGRLFSITVIGRNQCAEVVGDHAVVGGGMLEGFNRQIETGGVLQRAIVVIHLGNDGGVVAALHHDGDVFMVLGCGAHHGRAADIDILDGVFQRAIRARDCLGERIKVNDHHVDRLDVVLAHDRIVLTAAAQNAAVYFGMQGLNSSVHHFRETGVVGNFGNRQAGICQQAGGAAGGE